MPSPFPGMDPYLEAPEQWPNFHTVYIVALQRALKASLPAGFGARAQERVYISFPPRPVAPDVSVFATATTGRRPVEGRSPLATATPAATAAAGRVDAPEVVTRDAGEQREPYLEVFDLRRGPTPQLVAVLQLLSPANKSSAGARQCVYRAKQEQVLAEGVHLLEIDLLRGGLHTVTVPEDAVRAYGPWDYLVCLSDALRPLDLQFWRIPLREHLPALLLPLTQDVAPVRLDLQEVFAHCFDESGLGDFVDYTGEPIPPLSPEDAAWADALLRERGLRP